AGPRATAEVADIIARPRVVRLHRPGNQRPLDRRVREADVGVVDVTAEQALDRPSLALAEEVRLVEPDEAADPGALPHRRAEVHVAGALLLHREDDVHVTLLLLRRADVGRRHGRLEEAQVADALPAPDEEVPVEHG